MHTSLLPSAKWTLAACALALLATAGGVRADTNVGGIIASDTTWTTAGGPYLVTSNLLIVNSATLTVEPGVEVRFSPGTGMEIGVGALASRGTAAQPVRFTSTATGTVQSTDRWNQVLFSDGAVDAAFDAGGAYVAGSIMAHTIVEHAGSGGSAAVYADYASPYLNAATVRDNAAGGVFAYRANGIRVDECQVADNTGRGIGLNFSTNAALKGNTISGNVTNGSGAGLWANDANGLTLTDNRILTNESTANAGGGMDLDGNHMTLTGNTVSGNRSNSTGGGIHLDGEDVDLIGNVITDNYCDSQGAGIALNADDVRFQHNTFSGNDGGWRVSVFIAYSDDVSFTGDRIIDNPGTGLYAFTSCDRLVVSTDPNDPTRMYGNGLDIYNRMAFTGSFNPAGDGNIDARNVYWQTMDTSEVALRIYDYLDDSGKGVVFYDPVAVPEPATLVLLAVGGAAAVRRRRSQ